MQKDGSGATFSNQINGTESKSEIKFSMGSLFLKFAS